MIVTKKPIKFNIEKNILKNKINKVISEFIKAGDVDGRQVLYQYTDTDMEDLKEDINKLLDE